MKDELKAMFAQAQEKLRAAGLLLDGDAWGDASDSACQLGHQVFVKLQALRRALKK